MLDLTKPLFVKKTGHKVLYVGRLSNGKIIVEAADNPPLQTITVREDELENMPEEKIIDIGLFEGGDGVRVLADINCNGGNKGMILSKARVVFTVGKGWSFKSITQ